MKKYTVTNNETGHENHYSNFGWNMAWCCVFMVGVICGILLSENN